MTDDAAFEPTHSVPPDGISTWSTPDPSAAPDNRINPGLPVQVLEETTGWAHVRCSNGWECWVDARLLIATATPPPAAAPTAAPVAVPEPAPPPAPQPESEPASTFAPTHRAPATGLGTREQPDPTLQPSNRIDPGLDIEVLERAGDWARVRCSNGWEIWVDGRYLVAL